MTGSLDKGWWHGAVGYEVYIRSFADSNGDGIGDIRGIHERLGYLAWLGVDFIWITPWYPSPMADHGYDVADYCNIDPSFGTLTDAEAMIERAHDLGLRVVIDIVPNHTSDHHAWFRAARSSRTDSMRDRYVWGDPAPDGGPPNNWVSHFGGPAWTFDDATGQYYLHLFLPEQPDLNWRNPEVVEAFHDILRFWLARGVNGFRIDVSHALVKDAQLRSNPQLRPVDASMDAKDVFLSFEHRYDLLQPESLDVFRGWRDVVASHGALLMGETYVRDASQLGGLLDGTGMYAGFWFGTMWTTWDPASVREVLEAASHHQGAEIAWAESSHDEIRAPSRFGGGSVGRGRALSLLVLIAGLPGVPVLFEGDELGLEDGIVPPEHRTDPIATHDQGLGRDGCRTPMPWDPDQPGLGFTTGTPWLPIMGRTDRDTVAVQRRDPDSYLSRVRELLRVRRALSGLADAPIEWPTSDSAPLVWFRRGDHVFVANCGALAAPLPVEGTVLYHSNPYGRVADSSLPPGEAVIIDVSEEDD